MNPKTQLKSEASEHSLSTKAQVRSLSLRLSCAPHLLREHSHQGEAAGWGGG